MGSTNTPSWKHAQHDATVLHQSYYVGIQGRAWLVQLELFPLGPTRMQMQGDHIWVPWYTWVVGQPRHRYILHCPLIEPLPMQSLFCPGYTRIPLTWIIQTISPKLPSTFPHVEWTLPSGNQWSCNNITRNACRRSTGCPHRHNK